MPARIGRTSAQQPWPRHSERISRAASFAFLRLFYGLLLAAARLLALACLLITAAHLRVISHHHDDYHYSSYYLTQRFIYEIVMPAQYPSR